MINVVAWTLCCNRSLMHVKTFGRCLIGASLLQLRMPHWPFGEVVGANGLQIDTDAVATRSVTESKGSEWYSSVAT